MLRHSQQPGDDWDFGTLEPAGVSTSIPVLVKMANANGHSITEAELTNDGRPAIAAKLNQVAIVAVLGCRKLEHAAALLPD